MACGLEGSDHFGAWMTLVGAGIALAASLATAALSSFFENRRETARRTHADQAEEARRRQEDAVRFHADRLAAYIDYAGAARYLVAIARVWIEGGSAGAFMNFPTLDLRPYTKAMTRVRMLAKPSLLEKVRKVDVLAARLGTEYLTQDLVTAAADDLNRAVSAFEAAAQDELGITQRGELNGRDR
jgi:hypothetical protein